jgi:hypothetical protein
MENECNDHTEDGEATRKVWNNCLFHLKFQLDTSRSETGSN